MSAEYLADLDARSESYFAAPQEDLKYLRGLTGAARESSKQIMMSGDWLHDRLRDVGADAAQCESVCFANGQRCFGQPDVWKVAQESLDKYVAGKPDVPGRVLAKEIAKEFLGGDVAARRKKLYEKYSRFAE